MMALSRSHHRAAQRWRRAACGGARQGRRPNPSSPPPSSVAGPPRRSHAASYCPRPRLRSQLSMSKFSPLAVVSALRGYHRLRARLPLRRVHYAARASDRSCFMTFETDSEAKGREILQWNPETRWCVFATRGYYSSGQSLKRIRGHLRVKPRPFKPNGPPPCGFPGIPACSP